MIQKEFFESRRRVYKGVGSTCLMGEERIRKKEKMQVGENEEKRAQSEGLSRRFKN
jgi:hypothetical protein